MVFFFVPFNYIIIFIVHCIFMDVQFFFCFAVAEAFPSNNLKQWLYQNSSSLIEMIKVWS